MLHPSTALSFIDPIVGYGVVATEPIHQGTIVWTLDPLDQVISARRRTKLAEPLRQEVDRYSYCDGKGRRVLCWDHARFVNHSCDASCLRPARLNMEIAVRDIAAGEQLTHDYRNFTVEEAFPCACGAACCAGTVAPVVDADIEAKWRRALLAGFGALFTVPQPLLDVVKDTDALDLLWDQGPEALLEAELRPQRLRLVAGR